jgi:nesprin-1
MFQILQTQLDEMDDLFKAISKKFQLLIKDLTRDEVNEMMLCIKKEKGKSNYTSYAILIF